MNKLLLVLLSVLLVFTAACEKKKEEQILPKVDSVAPGEVGEQAKLERETYIREAQKELDELAVSLAEIRKKAVVAKGNAREKLDQQIQALEQEQKDVAGKLLNLKSAIGEKWQELKSDFATSFAKFKQSVKNAI